MGTSVGRDVRRDCGELDTRHLPSVSGHGYFMVASDGGVFAFGDAHFAGSCPGIHGCAGSAVAVVPDTTGNGYRVVTNVGSVHGFGDAGTSVHPVHEAPRSRQRWQVGVVRGITSSTRSGQVFAYGYAHFQGSLPSGSTGLFDPATAVFATSDGGGYWVTTALGKVFAFGDAPARWRRVRHALERTDRRG